MKPSEELAEAVALHAEYVENYRKHGPSAVLNEIVSTQVLKHLLTWARAVDSQHEQHPEPARGGEGEVADERAHNLVIAWQHAWALEDSLEEQERDDLVERIASALRNAGRKDSDAERDAERIEGLWALLPPGLPWCGKCNGSGGVGELCKQCNGVGRLPMPEPEPPAQAEPASEREQLARFWTMARNNSDPSWNDLSLLRQGELRRAGERARLSGLHGSGGFGTDIGDSAALLALREAIDVAGWKDPEEEERADYVGWIRKQVEFAAKQERELVELTGKLAAAETQLKLEREIGSDIRDQMFEALGCDGHRQWADDIIPRSHSVMRQKREAESALAEATDRLNILRDRDQRIETVCRRVPGKIDGSFSTEGLVELVVERLAEAERKVGAYEPVVRVAVAAVAERARGYKAREHGDTVTHRAYDMVEAAVKELPESLRPAPSAGENG